MATWYVKAFTVFKMTDKCIECVEERAASLPETFPELLMTVVVDEAEYQGGINKLCDRHAEV